MTQLHVLQMEGEKNSGSWLWQFSSSFPYHCRAELGWAQPVAMSHRSLESSVGEPSWSVQGRMRMEMIYSLFAILAPLSALQQSQWRNYIWNTCSQAISILQVCWKEVLVAFFTIISLRGEEGLERWNLEKDKARTMWYQISICL